MLDNYQHERLSLKPDERNRFVQSFLIDSGLTTSDYGWGTYAFRQLGLHKVQLVYNLAKTGVKCAPPAAPPRPL